MIFGTVGTHTQGFDRLVRALDQWARTAPERVVIQTGASHYEPCHAEWFRFDTPMRIESLMKEARVVVTHGGAGSLLTALECGRTVLAVPRRASLGEHVDDHQLELCVALEEAGLIRVLADCSDLDTMLLTLEEMPMTTSPAPRARLMATIAGAVASLSPKRARPGPNR